MIRSTYRNIMLGALVVSVGASVFMFRQAQDFQQSIVDKENEIIRLRQERENAESLHVAYVELDGLTITEQTATQLDILRHLGLEQSDLDFQMENRDVQAVGSTNLYIHSVRISGKLPYQESLALIDRLQNTKKIVLDSVELTAPGNNDGNKVGFALEGKIYGLDKTPPPAGEVSPQPEAPAEAAPVSSTDVTPTASVDMSGTLAISTTAVSATGVSVTTISGSVAVTPTAVISTSQPSPTVATQGTPQ